MLNLSPYAMQNQSDDDDVNDDDENVAILRFLLPTPVPSPSRPPVTPGLVGVLPGKWRTPSRCREWWSVTAVSPSDSVPREAVSAVRAAPRGDILL